MERLRVLITVKTYPRPSRKYEETVCTAGVHEAGGFVRLYPVRFGGLPYEQKYRKYDWIELRARRSPDDDRPESYRPDLDSGIRPAGNLGTEDGWAERKRVVLPNLARSMEALWDSQQSHGTSLGLVRPVGLHDLLVCEARDREWKPQRLHQLRQAKLFGPDLEPLQKLPYEFRYHFHCDDPSCQGHKMLVEDWEVGALYFRVLNGSGHEEAAVEAVRRKFLKQMCAPNRDTCFYVGDLFLYPHSWVVLGVFWPPKAHQERDDQLRLPL